MTGSSRFPRGILFLTVFLDVAGFGMLLPLLPFYAQRYGADAFAVGVLFSSYSLAQALFAPVLGRLSDRYGRRPVLMAALAANCLALLLFASASSFAVLLIARIASGMAAANFSIAQAYIADVTRPEERARGLGLVGAALGMGFVTGPGLGGLLSLLGQVAVPIGAAVLTAADLALVAARLPESLPPGARRFGRSWNPIAGARAVGPRVGALLGLFFLVVFAFSTMEATLALYCAARFGFGVMETSILLVVIGLVIAGVQGGAIGPLVARFGERRLVPFGIALMAIGLAAVPLAPNVGLLGLAGALLATGNGVHQPSLLGLVSRATSGERQGSTLGVSRSLQALARTFGPLWGGWAFDALGISTPFFSAAVLMALALVAAFVVVPALGAPGIDPGT